MGKKAGSLRDLLVSLERKGMDTAKTRRELGETERALDVSKEVERQLNFEQTALAAASIRLELQQQRAKQLFKLQQLVAEANEGALERKVTELSAPSAAKDYLGEVLSLDTTALDALCASIKGITEIDVDTQLRPTVGAIKTYGTMPPKKLGMMAQRWPDVLTVGEGRIKAASDFLEGVVGLERKDAAHVIEHQPWVLGEDLEKRVVPVMELLRNAGQLSWGQVGEMLVQQPKLAGVSVGDAQSAVRLLGDEAGIKGDELGKLLAAWPRIALLSPSQSLGPTLGFLKEEIGLSTTALRKVITTHPQTLTLSLDGSLRQAYSWLLHMGVPQVKIERVVRTHPKALGYRVEGKLTELSSFLLQELELEKDKAGTLISKFPQILGLSVDDNLRPTVGFLTQEVQISRSSIGKMITCFPQFLGLSVDGTLRPHFAFLRDELEIPVERLAKVVASFPHLLAYSVSTNIRPTLDFLHMEVGVPRKRLGKLVANHPQILGYSVASKLKPMVCYFTSEIGVPQQRIPLLVERCPKLLGCSVQKNLRPTVSFFKEELHLNSDMILNIVTKYPALLGLSIDKNLRPKLEYLTDVFGIPRPELEEMLGTCPQLLAYSLEKRIKPRHRLLEAAGLKLGLHSMITPSDLSFYSRYGEGLATMNAVCPPIVENGDYYWHHSAALPKQPRAKPKQPRKPRMTKVQKAAQMVAAAAMKAGGGEGATKTKIATKNEGSEPLKGSRPTGGAGAMENFVCDFRQIDECARKAGRV